MTARMMKQKKVLQKYLCDHSNIIYIKNESTLGQFENALMLFNEANGEYINFLMDDDVFHVNKIEKMMKYFFDDLDNEIKLVTSHRQVIDDKGKELRHIYSTVRLFEEDTIIAGTELGNKVIVDQKIILENRQQFYFVKMIYKNRLGFLIRGGIYVT